MLNIGIIIVALLSLLLIGWLVSSIILFAKAEKYSPQRTLQAGMIIASSCCIVIGGGIGALILYFTMNPISFM